MTEAVSFLALHALATVNEDAPEEEDSTKKKKNKTAFNVNKILRPVHPPLSEKSREVRSLYFPC